MPQSLASIYIHLVFSTKDRRPFLHDGTIRTALYDSMCGISHQVDCPIIAVGGIEDHVHVLGRLGRSISIADWVKELKRVSNLWLKDHGKVYSTFEWQRGYAAFSVSHSKLEHAERYILNQETKHHKKTFQDELRDLLTRHKMEWDERYIWD